MARLTITLPDELHRQLKLRSAMSGETIGRLLEQAVEDQRRLARARIAETLAKAQANAARAAPDLSEDELMALAIEETHAVREEIAAERAGNHRR